MWWGYVVTALGTLAAAYLAYYLGLRRDRDMDRAKRTADAFAQFFKATLDAQSAAGLSKDAEQLEDETAGAEQVRYWREQYKIALNDAAQARALMLTFGAQAVIDALMAGSPKSAGEFDANDPHTPDAMRRVALTIRADLKAKKIQGHPDATVAHYLLPVVTDEDE